VQPPRLQHYAAQLVDLAVHQGFSPGIGKLGQEAVAAEVPGDDLLQDPVGEPYLQKSFRSFRGR
jgi:hypothetical protein